MACAETKFGTNVDTYAEYIGHNIFTNLQKLL